MHSKVIIASLVCMLAVGFGNSTHFKYNESVSQAQEQVNASAPNDAYGYFTFSSHYQTSNCPIYAHLASDGQYSNISIKNKSSHDLDVTVSSGINSKYVTIITPGVSGQYSVTIQGHNIEAGLEEEIGTIFIYSDGQHDVVSSVSASETRALFYKLYAEEYRREKLFGPTRPEFPVIDRPIFNGGKTGGPITKHSRSEASFSTINNQNQQSFAGINAKSSNIPMIGILTKTDVEKDYSEFAYGTNDVETSYVLTPRTSQNDCTYLRVHANWIDENNVQHPLEGINVDFLRADQKLIDYEAFDTPIAYGFDYFDDKYTDSNGEYSIRLGYFNEFRSKKTVESLDLKFYAKSRATNVKDGAGICYPFVYRIPSNIDPFAFTPIGWDLNRYIYNYESIDYYVTFYPSLGERAAAYEIAQAQLLPFNYSNAFNDDVNSITTLYPFNYSSYSSNINGEKTITIKQEDYSSWDLLNHEYGHYICDELNLCANPALRRAHTVFEDLVDKYGEDDGLKLAYAEGLATYIGIASQLYGASNSTVPGVGDEIYQDNSKGLEINYGEYVVAGEDIAHYEGIETSVTSFMIKLLDDVERVDDAINLGHSNMWMLLRYSGGNTNGIFGFIEEVIDHDNLLSSNTDLRTLMLVERIPFEYFLGDLDEWTIMVYVCGADLESGHKDDDGNWLSDVPIGAASDDIGEILQAQGKPENVNIIIETGGSERWKNPLIDPNYLCRFEVGSNGVLQPVSHEPCASMGAEATFEDFMNWGLRDYPAEKTGVVIWNHGGALDGCCYDENPNFDEGPLKNSEASEAFKNSMQRYHCSEKLEFIAYDCCLMQVQDIADFNSQYFNYMVGSEAKVGGEGFVYDQWLEKLYDGCGTEEVLIEICDSYVASEGLNQYHMTFHRTIYIGTMSVLDLSKVEEYRIALEEFAASIHLSLITNFPKVSQFLVSHDSFALGKYCTIDVVYFLRALTKMSEFATFHNQAENVISHLMNLVKYNGVQPDAINYAFGLAAHFCTEERTTKYDLSETRFVNWRSLFAAYVLVE